MRLVLLSEGMTGRTHELQGAKTTVGRADDNSFPIPDGSVSSHHCEITLRGHEHLVRDLGSTNGTFINGEPVTESVLKPGEVLRLGQVAMRLETGGPAPAKPQLDRTVEIPRGVNLSDLDHAGQSGTFHPRGTGFSKRTSSGNQLFIVVAVAVGVIIGILLIYVFKIAGH